MSRKARSVYEFWATRPWNENTSSGCWEWSGSRDVYGYGRIKTKGKSIKSHRLMYEKTYGVLLAKEQHVCHKCDNPPCVNPEHLFVGSSSDNARDCYQKGRNAKGIHHGMSKLIPGDIERIRDLSHFDIPYADIGIHFGITDVQARNIISRKQWRHV